MADLSIPEEIIANIMWHLKPLAGPTRNLAYAGSHHLVDSDDYSRHPIFHTSSVKDQRPEDSISRATLFLCMLPIKEMDSFGVLGESV